MTDDDDPTMKSIGDSDSSSSAKFTTQAMTPSSTSSNARLREATIAPAKLTPAYLANKGKSLWIFIAVVSKSMI